MNPGAFVEVLPGGRAGYISELATTAGRSRMRLRWDEITVKVIEIDRMGRMNRRARRCLKALRRRKAARAGCRFPPGDEKVALRAA
jgi:hypothetical protein